MGLTEKIDDAGFMRLFSEIGARALSERLKQSQRRVYARRKSLEIKHRRQIPAPGLKGANNLPRRTGIEHPGRICINIKDGVVLIGSDAHYWPGPPSLMHRAFVQFCKNLKPSLVIMNGDVIDACTISRHPPINWERLPSVQEEIEAAQERLGEIERAAFRARKIWSLGNHDGRFETKLATVAPEFAKISGVHLRDHFALWEACWSVEINGDVIVKHRQANGVHAVYNNALKSGRSMITGHLHSAQVKPWTDYNGTRWGVDTGCLADIYGRQFEYMEDGYRNWVSAFGVLTFRGGKLLWPELVTKFGENAVQFRGNVLKV